MFYRVEDGKLKDGVVDEKSNDDDDDDEEEEEEEEVSGEEKNSGRKSAWSPEDVGDFIDIVVGNFTNTKCQRYSKMYEKNLTLLKKRASARGKESKFSVKQLRTKFSKCVSDY